MRKLLLIVFGLMLVGLQARIWTGEGSVSQMMAVQQQIDQQKRENERLYQRNRLLAREVVELQNGFLTLEEYARLDLGMVRSDEVFYLIYD